MYAGLIALNGLPAVQCTILDITERKQAEAALKVSEANYRHLFNAEPDAIIIVDAETKRIVDVNPAALKLYGYGYDEICGLQAVTLSAEPEKSAQHIRQIVVGGFILMEPARLFNACTKAKMVPYFRWKLATDFTPAMVVK